MEKDLVPAAESSPEKPRAIRRTPWKRDLIELSGKFDPNYRHHCSKLIIDSYSEVKVFPHTYNLAEGDGPCRTHELRFLGDSPAGSDWQGVTSVQFDSKGVYLASVTQLGCLTVHDFDSIQSDYDLKDNEANRVVHFQTGRKLHVVQWNLSKQNEVACASTRVDEVRIYDIGLPTADPVTVLSKRATITVCNTNRRCSGISDIAFCSGDNSRLFASDTDGYINIWDRRAGNLPCLVLSNNSTSSLNSIKLGGDNEIIYGADREGTIYMWDLRGGRSSGAFGNQKKGYFYPLSAVKLAHELEKISSLKAQSEIVPQDIHSIDFDPSCPYQLAFHLDDGWSGVLDINKLHVTQLHCPPPKQRRNEHYDWGKGAHMRKPCWLPMNSIYVTGAKSGDGIYFLDFYPDHSSDCHVDYNEDIQKPDDTTNQHTQNRFESADGIIYFLEYYSEDEDIPCSSEDEDILCSSEDEDIQKPDDTTNQHTQNNRFMKVCEDITACAAHPLNGTIVAGTRRSSLILISQTKSSE